MECCPPGPAAIQLTILRRGDLNIVDLAEVGSLIPRSETEVDSAFLAELAGEMAHLAGSSRGSAGEQRGLARQLERVGSLVFSHLLTEPARKRLRDSPPTDLHLRLDEELVHVPWELCHDGASFLATKFRIGRQVITTQPIPERREPPSALERLRVLLVADPTETLPSAGREAEQLCALLDGVPGVEVTLLGGKSVRRIPLLAALQEHDVVHFAGHSRYDAEVPARSGWLLHEGVLTAGELSKLARPPVLVFSNSCEAGASAEWDAEERYEGRAFGIGSAFLLGGVPNYVGTFWVVHDDESVLFATTCYRALAGGASLGGAMAQARQAVVSEHGWDRLTWASYLLYGDPGFRPLPSGEAPPPPAASPPPRESLRFDVAVPRTRRGAAAAPRVGLVTSGAGRVVGRQPELARLQAALAEVRTGRRQVVFVSGPPGIGKTTVLDRFLADAAAEPDVWVAQGQAIEQYGAGEAYLPLLEALGRLCRQPEAASLRAALGRHAPSWLAQLPGLLSDDELAQLRHRLQGTTRDRMERELAELVEVATETTTLVLALEDLHWSDHSTLGLLAYLTQRREPARLLVVATYRPAEAMTDDHPLRPLVQELRARRHATDLVLEPLGPAQVGEYLADRLRGSAVSGELGDALHRRTEGHPLFLVNVVDYLLQKNLMVEDAGRWALRADPSELATLVPDDLRAVIERQIEALAEPERRALEAASVVGTDVSVAAVAAALESELEPLEDVFEGLAWRGQFVRAAGVEEWPDGTVAGGYRFVHALYQNVLYDRIPPARRIRLHRRVALAKERAYGTHAVEIAGALAVHFEAARDPQRAVECRLRAGEVAIERHADREAITHLERGLALLESLPDDGDRPLRELAFLVRLVTPLMAVRGYAAPEVGRALLRARELGRSGSAGPYLPLILRGLVSFFQVRTDYPAALEAGEEMLALCERGDDELARVQAHYGHGVTLFDLGRMDEAQAHLRRALEGYHPDTHAAHMTAYGGYDPGVACRAWGGWIDLLCGWPERGLATCREGLALAEELGHPFSVVWAQQTTAMLHLYRSEPEPARECLAAASESARDHGFAFQIALGGTLEGWLLLSLGKLAEAEPLIRASIEACRATGAQHSMAAHLTSLAAAAGFQGRLDEGLRLVDQGIALCNETGAPVHLVELHRMRATLRSLAGADPAELEPELRRAVELARAHGTRWLELRAALDLARLLESLDRGAEVSCVLGPLCDWFVEGAELPELRHARALLAAAG